MSFLSAKAPSVPFSALVKNHKLLRQQELPGLGSRIIERKLAQGPAATVRWCREHIAPLRGMDEDTTLPVGFGVRALRYGMRRLDWATSRGIEVREPIRFIVRYAQKVLRGEISEAVAIGKSVAVH